MNLLRRIEKLEKEIWQKQKYNRPYKYFDSREQVGAWEQRVKDSGFNPGDFIGIILPPRPERVNWGFLRIG